MKQYTFHILDNPAVTNVVVLATSDDEAQHKLLSAVLNGEYITQGEYNLVHKERV
jgi:hypothetical protein